ncbi:glyoxylase-like metal-dependent hydrolase (beta-lactamase superfamily II) [Methylopila capsulata]|uniref:Glyoxylase-like metal-dependent hydrolase (Beta-lactamase superfamily II) n=1 Tax=Methylopila capsulata TaxID=61654 RepID=A0A9W6IVW8_9HYPH|nr:MBL fold metallo-hydrolase [Methylopila capsulata]MBM7850835.1 glyoxylase-like metal-dependent hydrolase (beta-lactamase superfamily II) [Methylopila capsulata]GLK56130.1 MBL fold metallo-hydrolase [Methylopila capsulata]
MSDDLAFDRSADAPAGVVREAAPLVRRVIAPNPSAFTFTGTATYLVGRGRVAVIDPGPDDPVHTAALLAALDGETVEAIVVTHSHRDHSAGVAALKAATGAPVVGAGPHRAFRALHAGEARGLEAGVDGSYAPDRALAEGEGITGPGWSLVAVETPGHTANHLAFALPESALLFSGDHVMAWSTSIVAPPDGAMGAYVASLRKLIERPEELYLPGHGPAVRGARRFSRQLLGHRLMRETAIRARLAEGPRTIPQLVTELYRGLDPKLVFAAGLSVFAHLEDLVAQGEAATDGPPTLDGLYRAP